jgi:hypothetical protein
MPARGSPRHSDCAELSGHHFITLGRDGFDGGLQAQVGFNSHMPERQVDMHDGLTILVLKRLGDGFDAMLATHAFDFKAVCLTGVHM